VVFDPGYEIANKAEYLEKENQKPHAENERLTTALAAAEEREAKRCEALEWYADMAKDRIFKESVN